MTETATDDVRSRLDAERDRLQTLYGSLAGETADSSAEELSAIDQHPADVGSETFEQSKEVSILHQISNQLADIDRAIARLDEGTYGLCEACGRPIGEERLAARPAARFCLADQAEAEAERGAGPGVGPAEVER
jgi:DnaK suppressor protein